MYKHGSIVMTSKIPDLVLASKFKKAAEKLLWFHTPADDQTGKFGVFPSGSKTWLISSAAAKVSEL